MKIKEASDYKTEELASLLRSIPFFKELLTTDRVQYDLLLTYSCIVELEPGETIMRRGEKGVWLYFLIKGRLAVYHSAEDDTPLNFLTPGELFGDLALLCDNVRQSTVTAEFGGKNVMLFATGVDVFGDLLDFHKINIRTKLIFYRTMVHSIRWRLEVSRMQSPNNVFFAELRQVPSFKGQKGAIDELQSLYKQAQFLAALLERWNSGEGSI